MTFAQTNGITTYYEMEGAGPTVVLVHGHSADLRLWAYQAPALVKAGFRVVRYDVRGHGHSEKPATGYRWEDYARDLEGLLDALEIGSAHVVGLSMGGGIALELATEDPGRVVSLTLVDSALPGFVYSQEFSEEIEALVACVRSEGAPTALERLWLTHPFFDGVRRVPKRFALLREMVLAYAAPDYREGAIPPDYRPQTIERLGEITAPTLVVVGEHDVPDFRLIAEVLANNLPRAHLEVIRDCWHLPPLEQPDIFNATLIAFLCKVERQSNADGHPSYR